MGMEKLVSLSKDRFKAKNDFFLKLNYFRRKGKNKVFFIFDFDRTLTKGVDSKGKNISTWEILRKHLPKKAQIEYQQFYRKYRPLEINNRLTKREANIWWKKILNLFKINKLNLLEVTRDIRNKMPARPCVKELFGLCEKDNIPTIIVSAGIKNAIEIWCQKSKIRPTSIIATNLIFSRKGEIIGWQRDSLVHNLNKKEKAQKAIKRIKHKGPNIILIGDSLDDTKIIRDGKKVLKIIVCDEIRPISGRKFIKKFDLVIKDGTLQPVVRILKLL